VINMQPGGRFNVSKTPSALPSKCVVCGAWGGDGRDFVDFGMDIDFYGAIYFCSVCLTECCNKLGYISPDQWQSVNTMNDELIRRIQILEADNVSLRTALVATDFLRGGYSDDSLVANEQKSDSSDEGISPEPDLFHGKDNKRTESDDSEFDGSSDERGYENVPSYVGRDSENLGGFGFEL